MARNRRRAHNDHRWVRAQREARDVHTTIVQSWQGGLFDPPEAGR